MKKLFLLIAVSFLFLAFLFINAFSLPSLQVSATKIVPIEIPTTAQEHLIQAVQQVTVSYENSADFQSEPFKSFHHNISSNFPLFERSTKKEAINTYSILYEWTGSNPSLNPILLMAHMDVVPIDSSTENEWGYPPFSGAIKNGFIWGRGTMDDKANIIAMLEAATALIQRGFKPKRTIYFAFGHDEEIGGHEGAKKIALYLKEHDIQLDSVLDEGLFILDNQLPGISKPIAFVGIAEKGYVDVELTVRSEGGHSSKPPSETTIGILSKAIYTIEKEPFPAHLQGAVNSMFSYTAPEMQIETRIIFSNQWLFAPLITYSLSKSATTNAFVRTTVAPTILNSGTKANVLPASARAILNVRILPGETIDKVVSTINEVVNDYRVIVQALPGGHNPIESSDPNSTAFAILQESISAIAPSAVVAPTLMIAGTDSRHYTSIAKNIFRFSPMHLTNEDLAGFHGINECLSIHNFHQMIMFYGDYLQRWDH